MGSGPKHSWAEHHERILEAIGIFSLPRYLKAICTPEKRKIRSFSLLRSRLRRRGREGARYERRGYKLGDSGSSPCGQIRFASPDSGRKVTVTPLFLFLFLCFLSLFLKTIELD